MLASSLYECETWHVRTRPRAHRFKHRYFMFFLDLDELSTIDAQLRLLSIRRGALYNFDQSDYLPDGSGEPSLKERANRLARSKGIEERIDKILLLTNLRIAGYVFNPVSFLFCYTKNNRAACCIAEVGNTFNEKKAYVLKPSAEDEYCESHEKLFYVSPFTALANRFSFRIAVPGETVNIKIDTIDGDQATVRSGLTGHRIDLSDLNLIKLTMRYPLATVAIIGLIHWHAFLLWLKGVPYKYKEADGALQVDVMRPHQSISARGTRQ